MFPLKGVIPPLVTPLSGRDDLDFAALERLIEHVIAGGVHGIFLLGTTGEGPSLSHRLQREVVREGTRLIDGRTPVLVGVTDTAFDESLSLARFAADQGADAAVLAAPYYFPMHQADLRSYAAAVAAASPLPVFLYNMPSHSKVGFEIATVRQLMEHENIAGMKDSSAQMLYFHQLLELVRDRPDFTLLMGPEELLAAAVLMGAHGGVCGGANLHPQLYVELYEAAVTGDLHRVHKLQHRVLRLSSRLYAVGEAPSGYLTGLKCALSCLGLCDDRLAQPLASLSPEKKRIIEQHLRDLGLYEQVRREGPAGE